ncbi:RloB domain-containing protein [Peptoniphilus sp. GNH]|nr:RloB domain-containing protein [Peptoniphilus sp. GNH]
MNRRNRKQKLKTTEKITIICEGESEESYIRGLIADNKLQTNNINFITINGGGYSTVKNYLEKNEKLINIVLVIMDLDRCSNVSNEKSKLKSLISLLEKLNTKNNIFLTFPNFESWIAACIKCEESELKRMGYKKGNSVYNFVRDNGGQYENGISKFMDLGVYFHKNNLNKGVYYEEYLDKKHSSLYYFVDYLKLILRKD